MLGSGDFLGTSVTDAFKPLPSGKTRANDSLWLTNKLDTCLWMEAIIGYQIFSPAEITRYGYLFTMPLYHSKKDSSPLAPLALKIWLKDSQIH